MSHRKEDQSFTTWLRDLSARIDVLDRAASVKQNDIRLGDWTVFINVDGCIVATNIKTDVQEIICESAQTETTSTLPPCIACITASASGFFDVALWDGSNFIIVDSGSSVITSPDGIAWSVSSTSTIRDAFTSNGSRYITYSGTGLYSSDDLGATWTLRHSPTSFTVNSVYTIGKAIATSSNGTGFLVVGSSSGTNPNLFYSLDGITWSGVLLDSNLFYMTSACAIGSSYYVMGYTSGTNSLYKSTTSGASWSLVPSPLATSFNDPYLYSGRGSELLCATQQVSTSTQRRLWSTTTSGSVWVEHTMPLGELAPTWIRVDGTNYYMMCVNASGDYHLYYSANLDSWTAFYPCGDTAQAIVLAVDPDNETVVTTNLLGGGNSTFIYRSRVSC